ncbi:MAG TPA: rhomboid family intramembrane serine protease, partial [Nitrososphaeraceae archaeon]|nr:rhomboid family intramembrane serine protease [Nitrososphaeraceae archaeon]
MIKSQNLPVATISLIALNLLVFAFGFLTNSSTWIITNFGFVPDSIFNRNSADNIRQSYLFQAEPTGLEGGTTANLIRLLSSMFIHASIAHIIFNMAALAYIGVYAERSIGTGRYVAIYFLSGICAALFHG